MNSSVANWREALLPEGASIEDVIRCLNQAAVQIAIIVRGDDELVGIITDGDIRRALLRGLHVGSPIDTVIMRDPLVVPPDIRGEAVAQIMRANRVHQIPVVDDRRRVIGLHLWDEVEVTQERQNLMVIMAGGLGRRLHPYTENCPKPMLPVAGKPILEHVIERARAEGFRHFVLAIRHLGEMIEEHFRDGTKLGVQIDYLREKQPLGTAGALGLFNPHPDRAFVVTNGDVLTDIRYGDLLDFHQRNAATATMAVRHYEWQNPFGVVHTRGMEITGFEEKPVHRSNVNAGIYALSPEALSYLTPNERCDMPELFDQLREQGRRTVVFPMHEPWLDVGRPSDYDQAEKTATDLADRKDVP